MKKLTITALLILTSGAAFALPLGNPSEPSLLRDGLIYAGHYADQCDPCLNWLNVLSVRIGFYGDYVFNRHMEVDEDHHDADIEFTEVYTNAGLIVANFWDRLDIFATLGATSLFIDTNNKAFNLGGTGRFEIDTETSFSWSGGIRGIIWECGCATVGGEAQYFYTNPHITRLTNNATTSVYPAHSVYVHYQEWQVGAGISYRINYLVPYVGVKWGRTLLKMDDAIVNMRGNSATLFDLENKKDWGYAIGVSLVGCEWISLTVESRFADEKAVHVNGQIRF